MLGIIRAARRRRRAAAGNAIRDAAHLGRSLLVERVHLAQQRSVLARRAAVVANHAAAHLEHGIAHFLFLVLPLPGIGEV